MDQITQANVKLQLTSGRNVATCSRFVLVYEVEKRLPVELTLEVRF